MISCCHANSLHTRFIDLVRETHSITLMCKGVTIGLHVSILFPQYVKIFVSVIVLAIDDDVLPPRSSIPGDMNIGRADILSIATILYRGRRSKSVHCLSLIVASHLPPRCPRWCSGRSDLGRTLGVFITCAVFSGLPHFKLPFMIHSRIHNNSIANVGLDIALY